MILKLFIGKEIHILMRMACPDDLVKKIILVKNNGLTKFKKH